MFESLDITISLCVGLPLFAGGAYVIYLRTRAKSRFGRFNEMILSRGLETAAQEIYGLNESNVNEFPLRLFMPWLAIAFVASFISAFGWISWRSPLLGNVGMITGFIMSGIMGGILDELNKIAALLNKNE